jgi:hypothetical protein
MKKAIWLYIIIAILSLGIIYLLTRKEATVTTTKVTTRVDTLRDTTKVPKPHYISKVVIRHDTIKLSKVVNDSVPYEKDSIIYIPITQKTYSNSNYKGYVSGYDSKLDSLYLYKNNTVKTNTVTVTKKSNKWGLGISAGYGISKTGLSPYIGIGVTYNLFR